MGVTAHLIKGWLLRTTNGRKDKDKDIHLIEYTPVAMYKKGGLGYISMRHISRAEFTRQMASLQLSEAEPVVIMIMKNGLIRKLGRGRIQTEYQNQTLSSVIKLSFIEKDL